MHFLSHYVRIIRANGPPRGFWSFVFERKNAELKAFIKNNKCYKDLARTIATRNQLHLAYIRRSQKINSFELGKVVDASDTEISRAFGNISSLPIYEYVEVMGNQFKIGTMLVSKFEFNGPIIGKIQKNYKMGQEVFFLMQNFKVEYYNDHICAHLINHKQSSSEFCLLDQVALLSPLTVLKTEDDNFSYVVSKYDI